MVKGLVVLRSVCSGIPLRIKSGMSENKVAVGFQEYTVIIMAHILKGSIGNLSLRVLYGNLSLRVLSRTA